MYDVITHPVLGMEFVRIPRASPWARQLWAAREMLKNDETTHPAFLDGLNRDKAVEETNKDCVNLKVAIPTLDELEWILACGAGNELGYSRSKVESDCMNGFGVYTGRGWGVLGWGAQWTTTTRVYNSDECWGNEQIAVCGVNKSGSTEPFYICYTDEAYVRLVIYDV